MLPGNSVHVTAQIESEAGHVEPRIAGDNLLQRSRMRAAFHDPRDELNNSRVGEVEQFLERVDDVFHSREAKSVVSGGHRRMRREDTGAANFLDVGPIRTQAPVPERGLAEQFKGCERRVSLIHVKAAELLKPECASHPNAADSQNYFLTQPVVPIASVQLVGHRPVPLGVIRVIRVQEVYRDRVSRYAADRVFPCPHMNGSPVDRHGNNGPGGLQIILDPPRHRDFLLSAVCIEFLFEVTLSIDESEGYKRQSQVCR